MPYSKSLSQYPESYAKLIEYAATKELKVPCADEKDARRMMGRLYAYLGALKAEAKKPDASADVRVLRSFADKVQFRVDGATLIARPSDLDPDNSLIEQVLAAHEAAQAEAGPKTISIEINPAHLPSWLADMAVKRAG